MKTRITVLVALVLVFLVAMTACSQSAVETQPTQTPTEAAPRRFTLEDAAAMFPMGSDESNAEYGNRVYDAAMKLKDDIDRLHDDIVESLIEQYRTTLADAQPSRTEEEFRAEFIDGFEVYYEKLLETAEAGEKAYRDIVDVQFYGGTGAGPTSTLWIYTIYHNLHAELEALLAYIVE